MTVWKGIVSCRTRTDRAKDSPHLQDTIQHAHIRFRLGLRDRTVSLGQVQAIQEGLRLSVTNFTDARSMKILAQRLTHACLFEPKLHSIITKGNVQMYVCTCCYYSRALSLFPKINLSSIQYMHSVLYGGAALGLQQII